MKKIITLILLFISIISFGQKSEYKKANKLYIDKQYAEANVILEKILNKEYGNLNEELEFYSLQLNLNCYYLLNDFKAAYPKAQIYLNFIKNTSEGFIVNKDEFITKMKAFIEELKSKIPQDSNSTSDLKIASESNSQAKTETTETKVAETTRPTSDDKTVTLTVSGTGKTLEEARLNALRSAIEQAFGAFISSKTEILNDNLVKDEIVSVANGNVQKYDIVSQVEVPNIGYAITLSATVSISKLTSFVESKGVEVEFKGGMFAANIKLQKLNEESERIAISNLTKTAFILLNNSIDFNLNVSEPTLKKNSTTLYSIDFLIYTNNNNNYESFEKYFKETLSKIYLKDEDVVNYKSIIKPVYGIVIGNYSDKINFLRNKNSIEMLLNFCANSQILLNSFKIYSNIGNIKYSYNDLYNKSGNDPSIFDAFCGYLSVEEVIKKINKKESFLGKYSNEHDVSKFFMERIKDYQIFYPERITINNLLYNKITTSGLGNEFAKITGYLDKYYPLFIDLNFKKPILFFTKDFEISELEKIDKFKIEKLQIEDFLKNSKEYILPNNLN